MSWYRAQGIAAAVLGAYELVAIVWLVGGGRFWFPIANLMGFYAIVAYLPAMIILLIVGQELTVRRKNSPRPILLFVVIALSLVMLAIQPLVIENLIVWLVAIGLAVANLARGKN